MLPPPPADFQPTHRTCTQLAICAALQCAVLVVVGLRFLSRRVTGSGLGWDDGLIAVATALGTALAVDYRCLTQRGLGYAIDRVYAEGRFVTNMNDLLTAGLVLYTLSVNLAKASTLVFYMRVFAPNPGAVRHVARAAVAVVAVWSVGWCAWLFGLCRPFAQLWVPMPSPPDACWPYTPLFEASCEFAIVTDVFCLAFPLPLVWSLNMRRNCKIRLTCLFAVGLQATGVSIARLVHTINVKHTSLVEIAGTDTAFYSVIEANLVILSVSLPMVLPLFSAECRARMRPGRRYVAQPSLPTIPCMHDGRAAGTFSRIGGGGGEMNDETVELAAVSTPVTRRSRDVEKADVEVGLEVSSRPVEPDDDGCDHAQLRKD